MKRYWFAVFIGAFLLFQIQPVVARAILPWFGGTPSVWTVCMLFFQVGLLAGYLYAHWSATRLSPRLQVLMHGVLMAFSLVFLPILPGESWEPSGHEMPVFHILRLLAATIGVPYLVLASGAPLMQRWFFAANPGRTPYRMYALSNAASLLALITYPFVIEPLMPLDRQAMAWSLGYGAAVVAFAACGLPLLRRSREGAHGTPSNRCDAPTDARGNGENAGDRPPMSDRLLWLALTATGSTLLLAVTNQICQDVAVIPFLWILPLAVYLLSFIACFNDERVYVRTIWVALFVVSTAGAMALVIDADLAYDLDVRLQITMYTALLLSGCMVCHGELVRRKPAPSHLTAFYVAVAAGGALGGVAVGVVAPRVFTGYWELQASIAAAYVMIRVCALRDARLRGRSPKARWRLSWLAGGTVLAVAMAYHFAREQTGIIATSRSFFGVLRVSDNSDADPPFRTLLHGRIKHGGELLDPEGRGKGIAYYGADSGIAVAIDAMRRYHGPLSIGVVGLGAGCIAAHGKEGDRLVFYELDPDVWEMAKRYFHYLSDTPARVEVEIGDGRLSLQRALQVAQGRRFNVLAVDAFSGDAIPVHLLTREAFQLYWRHLEPDGVLALHITNQHVDLSPLVRALADEAGKRALWMPQGSDDRRLVWPNEWVIVTGDSIFLADPAIRQAVASWPAGPQPRLTWTDQYSNLLSVLR